MRGAEFEAGQRAKEWFHSTTVPAGMWTVVRVDGRGFSSFTEQRFDKPFDEGFSRAMVATARAMLTEFNARYAYTESDEISIVLDPDHDVFGRRVEKIVSISAGIASATFTHAAGQPAHFDSRVWIGAGVVDVVDYVSWRQADATRCALNGWCYWTLRRAGATRQEATRRLHRTTTAAKNDLLFQHGINFNDLPGWQRRGIGLWWETHGRTGHDPVRGVDVTATSRHVHIEHDLPMKDAYRALVTRLIGADGPV
jgi:tRNA(His) guanylyltransferase